MRIRIITFFLIFSVFFLSVAPVSFSQSYRQDITAVFDKYQLYADDYSVKTTKEPFLYNGQTYVTAVDLANALGLKANYQSKDNKLVFSRKISPATDTNFYAEQLAHMDYQIGTLTQELKSLREKPTPSDIDSYNYREVTSVSSMTAYLRDYFATLGGVPLKVNFSHYSGDRYRLYLTFPYQDRRDFEKISRSSIERHVEDMFYAIRDLYDSDVYIDGYVRDDRSSSYTTYVTFETLRNQLTFDFKHSYYDTGSSHSSSARELKDALYKYLRNYNNVRFDYDVYVDSSSVDLIVYFDDEDFYGWSYSKRRDYLHLLRQEVEDLQGKKTVYGKMIDDDVDYEVLGFRFVDGTVRIDEEDRSSPSSTSYSADSSREINSTAVSKTLSAWFNDITVQFDNKILHLQNEPLLFENEVYVSVDDFTEGLNLKYQFDEASGKIAIQTNGVLRGDTSQALYYRYAAKTGELQKLTKEVEDLKAHLDRNRSYDYYYRDRYGRYYDRYNRITSISRLESQLQDYFNRLKSVPMNISISEYSGNEYTLRITYSGDDFDTFDKIERKDIRNWIESIHEEIKYYYDPYAKISGSVRNKNYSTTEKTNITFKTTSGKLSFDFDKHGR